MRAQPSQPGEGPGVVQSCPARAVQCTAKSQASAVPHENWRDLLSPGPAVGIKHLEAARHSRTTFWQSQEAFLLAVNLHSHKVDLSLPDRRPHCSCLLMGCIFKTVAELRQPLANSRYISVPFHSQAKSTGVHWCNTSPGATKL